MTSPRLPRVAVIGAGIGGLTTAATLARAGLDVTVLEAHVYPGGCAGTFYHQGFLFDAGATLAAGFYPGGPMDAVAQAAGIPGWPNLETRSAMMVHLPDGSSIQHRGDDKRWPARLEAFGPDGERFWRWQERTADALWGLAMRSPPWPPQSPREALQLLRASLNWTVSDPRRRLSPGLAADAFRSVDAHLAGAGERLSAFVDAQLLISAQATASRANALYGASALDLPRRGVVHLAGGMGALANGLADAVRASNGAVLLKHRATRIVVERGRPVAVETKQGTIDTDLVVANLPPRNIAEMMGDAAPRSIRHAPRYPSDGWGAFTLYVGIDESVVPRGSSLHHQVVNPGALGEGVSVFISISPDWDASRAPTGTRSVTISTHTALEPWWELFGRDRPSYERRKALWEQRALTTAERALPGLREGSILTLAGTPVTFQRFTGRIGGWVGGYPQTSLLRMRGPQLAPGLWMVGDSIFPGQSTAAVALGGLRVAGRILAQSDSRDKNSERGGSRPFERLRDSATEVPPSTAGTEGGGR